MNIPGPSTPPLKHHRRLTNWPNPPRHWGQFQTQPESVSTTRLTYPVIWVHQGGISKSNRSDMFFIDYRQCQNNPEAWSTTKVLESTRDSRMQIDSTTAIAKPPLSKLGNHASVAQRNTTHQYGLQHICLTNHLIYLFLILIFCSLWQTISQPFIFEGEC